MSSDSGDDIDDSDSNSSSSNSNSNSMFEYELDSQQAQEERKNFDYDFTKEEYINPIVVKGPDGTISVGTESKNKDTKEALCWNCLSHIIYPKGSNKVRCFNCQEIVDTTLNNKEGGIFIKC